MKIRSKVGIDLAPSEKSDDKLGAHPFQSQIDILTVNVRGMKQNVEIMKNNKEK
jgi:hypothetical protein